MRTKLEVAVDSCSSGHQTLQIASKCYLYVLFCNNELDATEQNCTQGLCTSQLTGQAWDLAGLKTLDYSRLILHVEQVLACPQPILGHCQIPVVEPDKWP